NTVHNMTAVWKRGVRIQLKVVGDLKAGLILLLNEWSIGTLLKTKQKKHCMKLVKHDEGEFDNMRGETFWNIPPELILAITVQTTSGRTLLGQGWPTMARFMVAIMLDITKDCVAPYLMVPTVKMYLAQREMGFLLVPASTREQALWCRYLKRRRPEYPFVYPVYHSAFPE
ncbi:hypothetical protein, partial [Salmonella enterica]|uniref:hypothetical protein n=1 Tax=Salmonella enterica TaxID=28901 RepID=UPI00135EF445